MCMRNRLIMKKNVHKYYSYKQLFAWNNNQKVSVAPPVEESSLQIWPRVASSQNDNERMYNPAGNRERISVLLALPIIATPPSEYRYIHHILTFFYGISDEKLMWVSGPPPKHLSKKIPWSHLTSVYRRSEKWTILKIPKSCPFWAVTSCFLRFYQKTHFLVNEIAFRAKAENYQKFENKRIRVMNVRYIEHLFYDTLNLLRFVWKSN